LGAGLCKTYTISPTSHQVLFGVTDQVGNIAHCPYERTWGPEMMLHNGQHGMSKGEIHGNQHLIPREKKIAPQIPSKDGYNMLSNIYHHA